MAFAEEALSSLFFLFASPTSSNNNQALVLLLTFDIIQYSPLPGPPQSRFFLYAAVILLSLLVLRYCTLDEVDEGVSVVALRQFVQQLAEHPDQCPGLFEMAKIAYKPRFLTISSTSALNTPWLRPVFSRANQHVLYSVYFESKNANTATGMGTGTIGKGWPEWMRPLVENEGSRQFLVALEEFKQKKIGAKPDLHFFHDGGVEALKEEISQLTGSDWEDLACFVVVDAFPNPREILLFLALWFSALFLSIPIQKGLSRMRRRKAL